MNHSYATGCSSTFAHSNSTLEYTLNVHRLTSASFDSSPGLIVPQNIPTLISFYSINYNTLPTIAYISATQFITGLNSLFTPFTITWARYLLPFESRAAAYLGYNCRCLHKPVNRNSRRVVVSDRGLLGSRS